VIPNHVRLFAEPREVLKYQEIDGAHAAAADLSKAARYFPVCEVDRRRLFEVPRTWEKLPDPEKVVRVQKRSEESRTVEETRRTLFEQPREVIKYQDVAGSHPSRFYPESPRRLSPTFASSIFP
jgi:hypothetical protein